ncbi:MAG TPA: hypothetical protein PL196_00130, partial [Burkholderiaceae bacterium]|nr:hypothetical protein [Burkholderiaceae bacterium]
MASNLHPCTRRGGNSLREHRNWLARLGVATMLLAALAGPAPASQGPEGSDFLNRVRALEDTGRATPAQ